MQTHSALEPRPAAEIALSDDAWRAVLESQSPHTRRVYRSQWTAFVQWCAAEYVVALPADPSTVANYLAQRVGAGLAVSSARLAAAAIRAAHLAGGEANPCESDAVRRTLAGLAREKGQPQAQASALDADALAAIKATAFTPRNRETEATARARALVDVALVQVLSDGGLRRSEASALSWSDIETLPDGSGLLHVRRSKTDAEGEGAYVALSASAMQALHALRPADPEPESLVFGLSVSQISRRVDAAARAAGLGEGYSGHSGRVGLAQRMAKAGAPANVTMRQGRWKSADTLARYTRKLEAQEALAYLD